MLVKPPSARPHHVVFIADPQLVDPHTYPGRPWPLSSLTVAFTDKYLKRSYKTLQRHIDPDTILFLGDLFDGGREWDTIHSGFTASEDQWKGYGQDFWLREYDRFGRIFFDPDQVSGGASTRRQKTIHASLPGNHDLGFGMGVQPVVRRRFHAYFGEGDRVDIIGNHTFVSLDTVSLSAMDNPEAPNELWNTSMAFLDQIQNTTQRMLRHELSHQQATDSLSRYVHATTDDLTTDLHRVVTPPTRQGSDRPTNLELPTVVLSHVPFYREPGTPCGPLRERHPPSAPNLENDEPNAIRVAGGYQYQNVLTRDLSRTIAEKVGGVGYVFSGDDHDYCEVVHRAYPSAGGGIREITVKSMSWAMGVRKPGFLLASLWNPIDERGRPLSNGIQDNGAATLQTHLCLLPDQLGLFIRYAICLVLTIGVVIVHAVATTSRDKHALSAKSPVLPTRETMTDARSRSKGRSRASSTSTHAESNGVLAPRSQNARTRSVSPGSFIGGYGLPSMQEKRHSTLVERAGYYGRETDDWGGYEVGTKPMDRRRRGTMNQILTRIRKDLLFVAVPSLVWYYWLMSTG